LGGIRRRNFLGYWTFRNTIRHILVFFARLSQNQLLNFCAAKKLAKY